MKVGGHGQTGPSVIATVGKEGARMTGWRRTGVLHGLLLALRLVMRYD
jgi:hypothetical protein